MRGRSVFWLSRVAFLIAIQVVLYLAVSLAWHRVPASTLIDVVLPADHVREYGIDVARQIADVVKEQIANGWGICAAIAFLACLVWCTTCALSRASGPDEVKSYRLYWLACLGAAFVAAVGVGLFSFVEHDDVRDPARAIIPVAYGLGVALLYWLFGSMWSTLRALFTVVPGCAGVDLLWQRVFRVGIDGVRSVR